jgi:glucosamine-6-phosphate deaminase
MADFSYEPSAHVPFRDLEAIERCRNLTREELVRHPNPEFRIRIVPDEELAFLWFGDIVDRIVRARDEGRRCVMLLPNPWPGYRHVARLLNAARIDCSHLWAFAMDEYADQDGSIAPYDWEWGFTHAMVKFFWAELDEALRPPRKQFVGFTKENLAVYGKMMEDLGGAEIAYFGPGWTGHLAFVEPDAPEFDLPLEEWKRAGARIVTLSPFTLAQNSLHGCFGASGDLARVPPKAATIGPAEAIACRHRWDTHGISIQGTVSSWQRLATRLCLHGPVTPRIPGSLLQTLRTDVFVTETAALPIEQTWELGY